MVAQNFFDIDFRQDNASGIWVADFHLGPQDIDLPENLRFCISKINVDTFTGYDNKTYWRMVIHFDKDKVFYLDWKNAKWVYSVQNVNSELNIKYYKHGREWSRGFFSRDDIPSDESVIAYLATEYFEDNSKIFFSKDTCLTEKILTSS